MRRRMMVGAAVVATFVAGCGGPEATPGGDTGDRPVVEEGATTDTTGADRPGGAVGPEAGPPRGMPMGGRMGEMHARMMGGGSPDDAPEADAASASAPGCPDIDQELVDRGRGIFAGPGTCFSCHGWDAAGSQLAPDLTDGEWLNVEGSYASIRDVIRTGVSDPRRYPSPMPPDGGGSLSEDQRCATAAYVYSLGR